MKKLLMSFGFIGAMAAATAVEAAEPLVDVAWVKANAGKPGIVMLDLRDSQADYLRAHVPGAVYTDYAKDGWRSKDENGTPAQLSPVPKLEALIGGLGIGNDAHVVLIPNGASALDMGSATRVYWTFKVLGHDNVSILDGGMTAYLKDIDEKTKQPTNPLDKGATKPEAKTFKAALRKDMIVTKADMQKAQESGVEIIDNRPNDQFIGVNRHTLAKRSGTIPGAKSVPESWLTQNGGGVFRSKPELTKLYELASAKTAGPQINFCNTGHWASLGWFVSHEIIGNKEAKLYDGSMLEWSADQSLPMEQKLKLN